MISGLYIAAGSGGMLLLLLVLFRTEEKHGHRVLLPHIRNKLDAAVLAFYSGWNRLFSYLGAGTVRVTFHYLVHGLLARLILFLGKCQSYLSLLQLRNKKKATTIRGHTKKSHLDEIALYKEEHSLSPEEKRKRKSQAVK